MQREISDWITVNGNHIPIYEGETKESAVTRAIAEKNEALKEQQIRKNKEESDRLNGKKRDIFEDLKSSNPDYEKIATDLNNDIETAGYLMLEKDGKVVIFGKNYNDNFSEVGPETNQRGMDSVEMAQRIKADLNSKWSLHKYDGQVQFPATAVSKKAGSRFLNAVKVSKIPSTAVTKKVMNTPDGHEIYRVINIGNKIFEYLAIKK